MTLQQAKDNLLKKVLTPDGELVLYGINLLPTSDAIGLIFYVEGRQTMFFSVDCKIMEELEK